MPVSELGIGHNQGSMIIASRDVIEATSKWLMDNPVVETEVQARVAKVQIDRLKLCLKDLDAEKTIRLKPHLDTVSQIRVDYRNPEHSLNTALLEVNARLGDFIRAEQARREEEARKAKEAAEAAKFAALEAERLEREAQANVKVGELDIDVVAATIEADTKFEEAVKAERAAIIAQKDTRVKIGGGFMRATSLRNKETLIIEDYVAALAQIGLTEGIKEAILTGARAYRKLNGRLPDGIKIETRQEL